MKEWCGPLMIDGIISEPHHIMNYIKELSNSAEMAMCDLQPLVNRHCK